MSGIGLTEELLARAERICRMVRMQQEANCNGYHEGGGASGRVEQGHPAEEKKEWLT